ncbi:MAG: helix-turn-helix transcriptional regulator [Cellulomonadaceae bacterium]|jgi:transcriptional regulator with XRE-family HTH domain|nr:helix-turn-helix transcriptional regulator [Cellulomonadaceae bacterium]
MTSTHEDVSRKVTGPPHCNAEDIATEVRVEMTRRRMTRTDLADAIGMKPASLITRLSGRTSWRVDELAAVAAVFGMTLAELLGKVHPSHASISEAVAA